MPLASAESTQQLLCLLIFGLLMDSNDQSEAAKSLRGESYYAFTPEMYALRKQCEEACYEYNKAGLISRRKRVELWRNITSEKGASLPPPASTPEEDDLLFSNEPFVETPIRMDYGTRVHLGANVYINSNSTWIDTCPITIGARTLVGPNSSFYSGSHPLDPFLRNGTKGPEAGKPITIGEDCWLGGNVTVVPGVTIGRGATVGAGSVVTRDVPAFHCVAGNPARIIRKVEVNAPDLALTG